MNFWLQERCTMSFRNLVKTHVLFESVVWVQIQFYVWHAINSATKIAWILLEAFQLCKNVCVRSRDLGSYIGID